MANSKNSIFQHHQFSIFFHKIFMVWSLGYYWLMWRALVWLDIYSCEAVQHKLQNRKKWVFCVLGCFWAYVRQPHDHISRATPMPFSSTNSSNPRTNPWKFHEKISRRSWKTIFFLVGHFEFFVLAILIFFASSQRKKQPIHMRYHLFLHSGWFFQNLGIETVRTFMHRTAHWCVF